MTSGQYSRDRRAVMIVSPQPSAEAAVERFEQRIQILPRNRLVFEVRTPGHVNPLSPPASGFHGTLVTSAPTVGS